MAARPKISRRKSPSKSKATGRKSQARKKATAKKVTRKKAPTRKKAATLKKATRKKAAAPKKAAKKKPAAPKTAPIEALARKLVQGIKDPTKLKLEELYAASVVSREPRREPVVGLPGMRERFKDWSSVARSTTWEVRNSFIKQNTICMEWAADVRLADGRKISFDEVSIHQVKGGKIVEERYYYDPQVFEAPEPHERTAPAAGGEKTATSSPDEPELSFAETLRRREPAPSSLTDPYHDPLDVDDVDAPFEEDEEGSDIDPMDL